jgi:Sigma-70, region 4
MTPLDLLAPDQRAVLELVLRQDRSYGELSELLGIPERQVRERADAALRSLAGAPDGDVDTGRIGDWLLGQQTERAASATRTQLERSEPARAWAARAAERLREVGGERVPAVPEAGVAATGAAPVAPRPRPLRGDPAPRPRPARGAAPAPAGAGGGSSAPGPLAVAGSSRLGGALLIGVVALALAAFLVWFLSRGGDDPATTANAPAATATPSSTPQASGNDILLQGTNGSQAAGLMRLFKAQDGGVQFAIGAQEIPNNRKGEFYAVWFTKKDGTAKLLGFPQTSVTNNVLTVGGPGKKDAKDFPRLFATYDKVLITRETKARPAKPGPIVLSGTLPHGQ